MSGPVEITTPDGVADAYLARPDDQPRPGVLFIMDASGLRPASAAMADRIAPGGLVTDAPDSPHRSGADVKAELYFGFADHDPSMSADQIAALERILEESGARYRSEVYDGARHGFTMADQTVYDEAAAERHFR